MKEDISIKIQALEKEYNVILKQYEEAYKNYIAELSDSDFSKTDKSKYQLLLLNGISENTVCNTDTTQSINIGIYTNTECASACEQDPDCSGYQLSNKDTNSNYTCQIFKNQTLNVVSSAGGAGCYVKKSSLEPKTPNSITFVDLKGRSYWGTSGLSEGAAASSEECESMCASDMKCTGATFNAVKRYCWTRTGAGNLSVGSDNDYAIIPKLRQSMIILQNLNARLISINNQLSSEIENVYPIAKEDVAKTKEKQQELAKYYGNLLKEQQMIDNLIREYHSVEEEYNNQSLYVNQQNMVLKVWVLIALLVLAATLTNLFNIPFGSISFIIIIVVVAVLFSFSY